MIAPPWFDVPAEGYGGVEAVVADIVDGLVQRGHHVTLIGAGRAGTRAQGFIPTWIQPPSERLGEELPDIIHTATPCGPARSRSLLTSREMRWWEIASKYVVHLSKVRLAAESQALADSGRPTLSAMRKDTMVVWNAFVAIFNGGRFEADPVRGVVVRVEPDPA